MAARRIKAVLTAEDRASPTFRKVSGALKALGTVAVAVGIGQLGRKLVAGLAAATREAGQYEAALTRLTVAARNQGQGTREQIASLAEFARKTTDVSLATENQILSALASAKALGATDEAAKKLVKTATDLAAATGVDQDTAFRQVIRTLGGYAGELGEIFPELKNLTQEQLRAGEAADVLNRLVRGAGDALANTFEGAVNNANSALSQLKVAIGGPLRDVFKTFLNTAITPFIRRLRDSTEESDTYRSTVLRAGAATARLAAAAVGAINALLQFKVVQLAITAIADKFIRDFQLAEAALNLLGGTAKNTTGPLAELQRELLKTAEELEKASKAVNGGGGGGGSGSNAGAGAPSGSLVGALFQLGQTALAAAEAMKSLNSSFDEVSAGGFLTQSEAIFRLADEGVELFTFKLERSGDTIEGLGKTMDRVFRTQGVQAALQLGSALVSAALRGDVSFKEFLKNLLAGLAEAILQALILQAILGALGFGGGSPFTSRGLPVVGGFVANAGGIAGRFRKAQGGIVAGMNFGRDTIPALLTPGEAVLPRELTQYLLRQARGSGGAPMEIVVHTDLPAVVEQINNDVNSGAVRLVSTTTRRSRGTR